MYRLVAHALSDNRRLRSAVILASFVALFGGGLLVYGVAWGADRGPSEVSSLSAEAQ